MKKTIARALFARSSVTYFNASRLFPPEVRDKVTLLYAYVRLADNFVDQATQDSKGLHQFIKDTEAAFDGKKMKGVVGDFARLARDSKIEYSWVKSFLDGMKSDLSHVPFETESETMEYMYGSAEVIGLMMARLLGLSPAADPFAKLLGRSMQYANFLRDIGEDQGLGRQYFATSLLCKYGLKSLRFRDVTHNQTAFARFFRDQVEVYRQWRQTAQQGFSYIPKASLVPIATADAMYDWTLHRLSYNPMLVYSQQLKPHPSLVIMTGIGYKLRSWLP